MSSEPCPLTGAESAVCRLVHHGPRPQAMLKPLRLELQAYVDKIRSQQKRRYRWDNAEPGLERWFFYGSGSGRHASSMRFCSLGIF